MKQKLMLVISGLLLAVTTLASPIGITMGDPLDIPIHPEDGQEDIGRPRNTSLFSVTLDTEMSILFVSALYYVGDVIVRIENFTTYEIIETSFNSAVSSYIPISGNSGNWRITLMLDNGDLYVGDFLL